MNRLLASLSLVFAVAACGDDGGSSTAADAAVDAFVGEATALFQVPGDDPPPDGFYALPYPNNIRLDEVTKVIDVSDHIRPSVLLEEYIEAAATKTGGFSVVAPGFFRFDNPIDVASLPQTPEDSLLESASVYLVNVDAASAHYGKRTPLRFRFETFPGEAIGRNWLAALPFPGFVLRDGTTYALVMTSRVLATDRTAVKRSADFTTIISAAAPSETALARAQTLYAPLWSWLDEAGGDERSDVVSAAVFTTQSSTGFLGKIRQVVYTTDVPKAREITFVRETEDYIQYDGIYDAPHFQRGLPPFAVGPDGEIRTDPKTGMPLIERSEELRFSFSIPTGPMPKKGWPLVLFQHGTYGNYHSYRNGGSARRLAKEGLAVIAIDQVAHGTRTPGGASDVEFFNFGNPLAARDNSLQGSADGFQQLRMAINFDYTERHPGGRTIRFDADRIYFFGHSQGSVTGPAFVAHEPMIKGAVFSGAGALLYQALLHKHEPQDIAGLVGAFIRDFPLDEFNPLLGMVQSYLDRTDTAAYARLIAQEPLEGNQPKHVYLSGGLVDRQTPGVTTDAFAVALGSHHVEPVLQEVHGLALLGHEPLTAPVTGNQSGVTNVHVQYNEKAGSDGHYVVFEVEAAQIQSAKFLGTLAATGTATLVTATD